MVFLHRLLKNVPPYNKLFHVVFISKNKWYFKSGCVTFRDVDNWKCCAYSRSASGCGEYLLSHRPEAVLQLSGNRLGQ
jgi:hypothetical protein